MRHVFKKIFSNISFWTSISEVCVIVANQYQCNWRLLLFCVCLSLYDCGEESVDCLTNTFEKLFLQRQEQTCWKLQKKWSSDMSTSIPSLSSPKKYISRTVCYKFSSVQLLSHVWLFATPWATACQASLSITNPRSPPKPVSIKSVMPFNHLIIPYSSCPQSFPESGSFQVSQLFVSGGQSTGVSASASVLPMNPRTDLI